MTLEELIAAVAAALLLLVVARVTSAIRLALWIWTTEMGRTFRRAYDRLEPDLRDLKRRVP